MRQPLISICIPTYNGSEHLAECLASVQAQTFTDFEVVLCDDQSTDGTLDFARSLVRGDDRFRFIQNPHRLGLVGNWNNCVKESRGEWIKFVFQDDLIRPACCEKLLAVCSQNRRRFGFCEREFLFDDTVAEKDRLWFLGHQNRLAENYHGKVRVDSVQAVELLAAGPFDNLVGEPTVTLIHTSVFDEFGMFNEALIQLCDSEMWNRVLVNHGAAFETSKLAVFRIHSKAATARNHRTRSYRANTLDPLVLLNCLAFGKCYQAFRESDAHRKTGYSLKKECALAAYRAWKEAITSRTEIGGAAPELRREWKAVRARYPNLAMLALLGGVFAMLAKARRALAKQ